MVDAHLIDALLTSVVIGTSSQESDYRPFSLVSLRFVWTRLFLCRARLTHSYATQIPEDLIQAAAQGLADSLTPDERYRNLLYPEVERIREVTITIAKTIIRSAQKAGVDTKIELRSMTDVELDTYVRAQMYHPLIESR